MKVQPISVAPRAVPACCCILGSQTVRPNAAKRAASRAMPCSSRSNPGVISSGGGTRTRSAPPSVSGGAKVGHVGG